MGDARMRDLPRVVERRRAAGKRRSDAGAFRISRLKVEVATN
jgi:hypothetical protein